MSELVRVRMANLVDVHARGLSNTYGYCIVESVASAGESTGQYRYRLRVSSEW